MMRSDDVLLLCDTISKAYESSNVRAWKRQFYLRRDENKIEVTESFDLEKESEKESG